ncbi:MAG: hypothetical protein IPM14_06700 [bacterium]|nr:hypothetical protein [bacterium]
MKIVFGTGLHKAQLVMELDITQPDEKKLADRIMNGKSITSIQHFIAGTDTPEGAVIIWNDKQAIKKLLGNGNFGNLCLMEILPQIIFALHQDLR